MSHYKSFSIHADRVSAKRCRTEISRDYTASQIMWLCYKTVESAKRTFNAEHFVSLIQRERLTHTAERAVTRRSRMSYHSNQRSAISETASSLITDRNTRHKFFWRF